MNLGRQFLELLPAQPLFVALVTAINGDGTSTVEFPNGSILIALGTMVAVGHYAFIRNRLIVAEAPSVSPITLVLPVAPPLPLNFIFDTGSNPILAPSGAFLVTS